MYKSLIEKLEDDYHLVAPDYPSFGNSDQPNINAFDYTFGNIANIINEFIEILSLEKFSIYVHDYGAPI
ncbi:alpha/beta fold hydrolase [Staphylococcus sp. AS1337]|uniref:alpha/beta fold hydrolase n=1 Tax=Staphylococcus sp. AS1337 TaxID=3434042 RepID=UPI003F577C79